MDTTPPNLLAYIPGELKDLIEWYSPSSLLNNSFSTEELKWLFAFRRRRAVFYAYEAQCEVNHYIVSISSAIAGGHHKGLGVEISIAVRRDRENNVDAAPANIFVDYGFTYNETARVSDVIACLKGSLPVRRGKITKHYIGGDDDSYADVVILDVHGVFLLMKRRLELAGVGRVESLARVRARQLLQEVADFYRDDPISLDLYLSSSVINLELNPEPVEYEWAEDPVAVTEEMLQRIRGRCEKYLVMLQDAIEKM